MKAVFFFLVLLPLLLMAKAIQGQQPKKLSWNDQFIIDKSGKPFPVREIMPALDGRRYDFSGSRRPAFVYISSESCLPCKFELPLYLEACAAHKDFDFVYFTTEEDTLSIKQKFGKNLDRPNLYVISKPYDWFYDNQLFLGFPTKYFINSANKVETVQLGGYMVKEKVLAEWQPVLTHLQ